MINPNTIFRTCGTGRIDWIYCFLGFRLPANALARLPRAPLASGQACEVGEGETEKQQSCFQRVNKAKEVDSIIAERLCCFFIMFL